MGTQVTFGQNIWENVSNSEHVDGPGCIIRLHIVACELIRIDPIIIAHTYQRPQICDVLEAKEVTAALRYWREDNHKL